MAALVVLFSIMLIWMIVSGIFDNLMQWTAASLFGFWLFIGVGMMGDILTFGLMGMVWLVVAIVSMFLFVILHSSGYDDWSVDDDEEDE